MRLSIPSALAGLLTLTTAYDLTLYLPSAKPNPFTLPATTHATLSSLHKFYSAPLSAVNTFVFRNLTADSYLMDVHCTTDSFQPLRVDISAEDGGKVQAWETFRGNEWGNKGEEVPVREGSSGRGVEVRALGGRVFFVDRPAFSILSILKNPMILMGIVTMGIVFGMPYLMDNMDPEMRAEFEEQQKKNPMNAIMGGGGGGGAQSPLGNFDMAAYLAGAGKKEGGSNDGGNGGGKGGSSGGKKDGGGVRR